MLFVCLNCFFVLFTLVRAENQGPFRALFGSDRIYDAALCPIPVQIIGFIYIGTISSEPAVCMFA